jgi:hypothetical protein
VIRKPPSPRHRWRRQLRVRLHSVYVGGPTQRQRARPRRSPWDRLPGPSAPHARRSAPPTLPHSHQHYQGRVLFPSRGRLSSDRACAAPARRPRRVWSAPRPSLSPPLHAPQPGHEGRPPASPEVPNVVVRRLLRRVPPEGASAHPGGWLPKSCRRRKATWWPRLPNQ